jgi:hypothetical protein
VVVDGTNLPACICRVFLTRHWRHVRQLPNWFDSPPLREYPLISGSDACRGFLWLECLLELRFDGGPKKTQQASCIRRAP